MNDTKVKKYLNKLKARGAREWQAGFSIAELILYMALLVILLTVLSGLFAAILDVQLESQAASSVDLDGRYITSKLIYDMHSMLSTDAITSPSSAGTPQATLAFTVNSVSYNYSLNNGYLQLVNDKGVSKLSGVDTTVSNLQFTRLGAGTNRDTIRVSFTLTSKVKKNGNQESRDYQTTISSQ